MAVVSNPTDFAAPSVKLGAKAGKAAFYLLIGAVALTVSVSAAMMSADVSLFDECYSACAAQTHVASN